MGNLEIKSEKEAIAAGTHFWCSGHLGAVGVGERSADPRSCNFCFGFLTNEVKILKETHQLNGKAHWLPKETAKQPIETPQKGIETPGAGVNLIGTPEHNKTCRGILVHTRGRPKIEVPVDKVIGLHKQGKGIRAIAKQVGLSPMTISRTVAGIKQ